MLNYDDWEDSWNKEQYVPVSIKELTEAEATYSLREAWKRIYGEYPKDESLALLFAQSALETGRWKVIRNNNFGNIKKKHYQKLSWKEIPDDGHDWTMFATGENLWDNNLKKTEWHWFEPPHFQTHFRSYKTVVDGAEDYIKLLSVKDRYKKAWQEVIGGNPKAFSHELKVSGYYTASEEKYTAGIVRLFNEFLKRKDELLSWNPEDIHEPLKELKKIDIQKAIEDTMSKAKNDGLIISTADSIFPVDSLDKNQNTLTKETKLIINNKKSPGKTGLFLFIATGITAAYAWLTGLF